MSDKDELNVRPRGRPKAEDATALAKEGILDAALVAFAEHGYEGMSMRKLARQLGVSHGLLSVRFGTKFDLWVAAVDQALARVAERISLAKQAGSIEERLKATIVETLESIAETPALLRIVNHESAADSERLQYLTSSVLAERYRVLEGVLAEGVAAGMFRDLPDRLVMALVSHGAGMMFAQKPLARHLGLLVSAESAELRRMANIVADFVLRAVRK